MEGWRVRKDGTTFWANIVITALHDNTGNNIGFTKITKDLTDRKLMEDVRQLAQKNKELEQLVYITSHDLQEPLSSITGFANILEQYYKGQLDEDGRKYLHYLTQSCAHMSNLIKALLDYSLIGRERKLERVDCNQLVSEVTGNLYHAIHENSAKIIVGELPKLDANFIELELLFQNLIGNAIKFRKKDISPEITIKASKRNDVWEFSIHDNGIGIDEKFQEKIFNIFQRLHNKSEFEGTGIGLAHCKKIVSLYGGNIWVESTPGEGSTFHFTLPCD
ncbi:MAG TPA: ATP-binding protein, partial [Balneolales bacterium]|nr:ATP-binding protein [Balneolales bacterium]